MIPVPVFSPKDFEQITRKAEVVLNLHPAIIEKDFWVCWMLGLLFERTEWKDVIVFKGGTALSKVFGVIRRFSEDIDLSLAPSVLGIAEGTVEEAVSRRQRDRWMEEMEGKCSAWVQDVLCPALLEGVTALLGPAAAGRPWLEFERDPGSQSPVLLFNYPCAFDDGAAYIRRQVKLEFGSLTDQRPTGWHRVTPWLAEVLPPAMQDMGCGVVALELERAFWEKATILHAEYHREASVLMPDRYSRHYADLAALAVSPGAEGAVRASALRQRVVDWKARFFARSWARYDLAVPGTFRLVPPDHRMAELSRDYREMQQMFLEPPPPFAEVLSRLQQLEDSINSRP
jgi:hypothetical protein